MIKLLAKSIREYKKPSLLAPAFVSGEVIMECIIPFITANLVNQIKAGCSLNVILRYGLNGHRPLTQREVASSLRISRSYVSRLEKKALETVREQVHLKKLFL